jgi:hypothetical protein
LQPCWEQARKSTPQEDLFSVGIWKDRNIEIRPTYAEAPRSLQYRIVEAKVAPYWSLQPPEIKLTMEVFPKPNVELPKGEISVQFKGCAVLAPEYWVKEEQEAAETLKKVLAKGDPETARRAQAYIDEIAARKRLLASSWIIEGRHQTEVSSYSSIRAALLGIARYGLWAVIVLVGLVFSVTLGTYLLALKAE